MMIINNVVKAIKWGIYSIVAIVPVFFVQTVIYPFAVPKTLLFQSIVEIIFFLWLGLIIFEPKYRLRFTPVVGALLVFIGLVFLSAILGVDFYRSFWSTQDRMSGIFLMLHFLAFFSVATSLKKEINWQLVFTLSFLASIPASLSAVIQHFKIFNFSLFIEGWERPGSIFGNPAFLSGYLLSNIFIGLWLALQKISLLKETTKNKVAQNYVIFSIIAAIVFEIYIVFLTQTRGAIIGLAAGFLIMLLYFIFFYKSTNRFNLKKIAAGCLILLVLFSVVFFITRSALFWQNLPGFNRLANFSMVQQQLTPRFIAWEIAWQSFLEKPILGWGWENFNTAFDRHYDPNILTTTLEETHWDKPHNIFLEYLVTGGVFSFLAYIVIFGALFYELYRSKINRLLKVLLSAATISYLIQNFVIFDTIGTLLIFFIILAFVNFEYENSLGFQENNSKIQYKLSHRYNFIFILFLAVGLIPVYFINWRSAYADNQQYWGVNYLLNRMPEAALVSYNNALAIPNPYIDFTRKDFLFNITQMYKQGIVIPDFDNNLKKGVEGVKMIIKDHPKDYFFYTFLANIYNDFSEKFGNSVLKEVDGLTQKSLELSSRRQETYFVAAKTKILEGNIGAAYDIFRKAINFNPQSGISHFYFGMLAYANKDYKKGAEEISIAESLSYIPADYKEAIILGDFTGDSGNYKKAIKYYKLAWLKYNNGGVCDAWLKLSLAYFYDGQNDLSRDTFLELSKKIDLKSLQIYGQLKPVFQSLKINL